MLGDPDGAASDFASAVRLDTTDWASAVRDTFSASGNELHPMASSSRGAPAKRLRRFVQ